MSRRAWLIAEREFRTYVATASFWIAALVTPLLLAAGAIAVSATSAPQPPTLLTLTQAKDGAYVAQFAPSVAPAAQAEAAEALRTALKPARGVRVQRPVVRAARPGAAAGLFLVILLWLVLTGSLGMLLQATVRERTNRALEALLASASPWDIVMGKLAGVGAVSIVVVSAWVGSSALVGGVSPAGGAASVLLRPLADPARLAAALVVYLAGYGFFGLAAIAVGVRARDNADAQNLARPLFGVLLAIFFLLLSLAGGAVQTPRWLELAPPLSPFLILLRPRLDLFDLAGFASLCAAALAAGALAVRGLSPGRGRA